MLVAIKLLHTVVWLFFVGCILAVPAAAWIRRFDWVIAASALVLFECTVLACNHLRCPMTDWAARYAPGQSAPNFDIYLPAWLAKYTKEIFGPLFLFGELFALARWLT